MIHGLSDVQSDQIGRGTSIWQFCVVLPGARIGADCNICSHVFVESDVVIGDRVTIKCGVQLWDGLTIEDDAFVGPNVTFTNDRYPPSNDFSLKIERTRISKGASLGANATILPGVVVGEGAMVGAGSVVTKDIPAGELWLGNPARFIRKLSSKHHQHV
jgi:UDP-2-acetamido-3-amino-2,3-dideoxy-glucuronate N-acetyltransferase